MFSKKTLEYLLILALLIALGLASRAYTGPGQDFIHLYIGDVLYATMYYFLFRLISPRMSRPQALIGSIGLCFVIEFGQIYHAPWIDGIRATRLGKLILGSGFLWSDLICYTLGAVLGWRLDLKLGN